MPFDGELCRCSGPRGHIGYLGRKRARNASVSHARNVANGVVRCRRCDEGMAPSFFQCLRHERIWHWGHGLALSARSGAAGEVGES